MSRTKDLLDDLELHLTPEERAERREVSELDARREEHLAQFRAFMPSKKLREAGDQSFPM